VTGRKYAGNVYQHWAFGAEMLAHIHTKTWRKREAVCYPAGTITIGEYVVDEYDEYVIDYRYLDDDNVEPIGVDPLNYAEMWLQYASSGRPTGFAIK
jgi:hypothetical protein